MAIAATPDGKYVAVGCQGETCQKTILARYDTAGTLDPSFGDGGLAIFDFLPGPLGTEVAAAIRMETKPNNDYSIVVAGEASERFALMRFNSDGSLDPNFGRGGDDGDGVVLGPGGSATSLALQGDNYWILAGRSNAFGSQGDDFILARFHRQTGEWDTNWPNAGTEPFVRIKMEGVLDQLSSASTHEGADAVVTDAFGKVYAVGYTSPAGSTLDDRTMVAIRLTEDGVLDPDFDGDGIFNGGAGSLSSAVLQGNSLLAAGRAGDRLAVIKLNSAGNSAGKLDSTFGDGGIAEGPVGRAAAMIEHGDTLVAAGRTNPAEDQSNYHRDGPGERDVLIARFNSNGSPDPDFGVNGSVTTDLGDLADEATSITVDSPPGAPPRMVIAGLSGEFRAFKFALARYQTTAVSEQVNLAVALQQGLADPVKVGDRLTYTVRVANRGPEHAAAVTLKHVVPLEADLIRSSVEPSQGVCSTDKGTIDCALGGIVAGKSATVAMAVVPLSAGTILSSASIGSNSTDIDLSDNSALIRTSVVPAEGVFSPAADLNEARTDHVAVLLTGEPCERPSQPPWCGKVLLVGRSTSELYDPAGNRWIPVLDRLKVDHGREYTATVLSDGRVLVVGSPLQDSSVNVVSLAEIYDPSAGTWTAINGPNSMRSGHVAVRLVDGRVLVAGGFSNQLVGCPGSESDVETNLRSAEIFDPQEARWETLAEGMNVGRASTNAGNVTATLLPNNDVLVVGGDKGLHWHRRPEEGPACDGEGPLAGAEIFDFESKRWGETAGPAVQRYGHTATLLQNGKVLITGGNTTVEDRITTPDAALYDPDNGWKSTDGLMLFGRTDHAAALLPDGKVLITGGVSIPKKSLHNRHKPKTAEMYDPFTAKFTSAGVTTNRWAHTATALPPGPAKDCAANCGKVLLTGGRTSEDEINFHEDPPLRSSTLYTAPPSIIRLQPPEGPVTGDTEVTISGLALASASKVTFAGTTPLLCGPKGVAPCWINDELPDRQIHVRTPPHPIPEHVDVVVETLPGLRAASRFRYTGVELPPEPPRSDRLDAGASQGNQQNTRPPAPPSGTATSAQTTNANAARTVGGMIDSPPPAAFAPTSVTAQSPQAISESAQVVQSSAAFRGGMSLQASTQILPGLTAVEEEEPRPAPRILFSAYQEYLVLAWTGAALLAAVAGCVFAVSRTGSGPSPAAAGTSEGIRGRQTRVAI